MDAMPEPFPSTARDRVTGRVEYTFDITLPRMLHGKLLRSPHAHARIRGIDTQAARAIPGVVAVLTGQDTAELPDPFYGVGLRDQPVIGQSGVFANMAPQIYRGRVLVGITGVGYGLHTGTSGKPDQLTSGVVGVEGE